MARNPRKTSETGFYHVMNRGISHAGIFESDEDYGKFLWVLQDGLKDEGVELHAYCLMGHHYHLLVRDRQGGLSRFVAKVNARYAAYFNRKYDRDGPLFHGRFRSECIRDEDHYLTVLRYILQNPPKGGLGSLEAYPWSSYGAYGCGTAWIETRFAERLAGGKAELLRFVQEAARDECLDVSAGSRKTDDDLRAFIRTELACEPHCIAGLARQERDEAARAMKGAGFSIRMIERVAGLSHGFVQRA